MSWGAINSWKEFTCRRVYNKSMWYLTCLNSLKQTYKRLGRQWSALNCVSFTSQDIFSPVALSLGSQCFECAGVVVLHNTQMQQRDALKSCSLLYIPQGYKFEFGRLNPNAARLSPFCLLIPIKFGIRGGDSRPPGHVERRLGSHLKALCPRIKACYAEVPILASWDQWRPKTLKGWCRFYCFCKYFLLLFPTI